METYNILDTGTDTRERMIKMLVVNGIARSSQQQRLTET